MSEFNFKKELQDFKSNFIQPKFNKKGVHNHDYVTLAGMIKSINEQITKTKLCYRQNLIIEDGIYYMETTIFNYENDENEKSIVQYCDNKDSQKQGGALTYARRYGLSMAFNIVAEDDKDGEGVKHNPANLITPEQKKQIENICVQTSRDVNEVASWARVSKIEQMTFAQANKFINTKR